LPSVVFERTLPQGTIWAVALWCREGVEVMNGVHRFGLGLAFVVGSLLVIPAFGQESGGSAPPDPAPPANFEANQPGPGPGTDGAASDQRVKPMTEGPLHEAFLSPRKDQDPVRINQTPPAPIAERPGLDPPRGDAEWIEGYWEWEAGKKDFVWVTG